MLILTPLELLNRELRGRGRFELSQAQLDGALRHGERLEQLLLVHLALVHPRGHRERRGAEAQGPPSNFHPIPLHGLQQAQRSDAHVRLLLAKVQLGREAVDVQARVHDGQLEIEELLELHERRPQLEHVDLQRIREVDEQIRSPLLATNDVQARRDHSHGLSPLHEAALDRDGEESMRVLRKVRVEPQRRGHLSNLSTAVRQRRIPRIAGVRVASAAPDAGAVGFLRSGAHELTPDAAGLLELDGRHDGVLLHHGSAAHAHGISAYSAKIRAD
eukprot:scaffold334_cov241-Pinguiococcus_pyrenoidosus.AAC.17